MGWQIVIPKPTWTGFCLGNIAMLCMLAAVIIIGAVRGWWEK